MDFRRPSLFLVVSSSIIGDLCSPNITCVSSMILFFFSFLSSTPGIHHHGAHCYCYFKFRPFSSELLINSISDSDFYFYFLIAIF